MKIIFKKSFDKAIRKNNLKIINKFNEKLKIFALNPFDSILNNHTLIGKLQGKRSINITGDYRAIFIEHSNGTYEFVEFTDFGTHSQLYG